MKLQKPGIRLKFIAVLIIAAVIPLCVALFSLETIGCHSYRAAQAALMRSRATEAAHILSLAIDRQVESLEDWAAQGHVERAIVAGYTAPRTPAGLQARIDMAEARWPALTPADPAEVVPSARVGAVEGERTTIRERCRGDVTGTECGVAPVGQKLGATR